MSLYPFKAFPEDFSKLDNDDGLIDYGTKILKSFTCSNTVSSRIIGKSFAQTECESYCSIEERCWGCSEDFHKPCKWNAIAESDNVEYPKNTVVGTMTQKTGSKNPTAFYIETRV